MNVKIELKVDDFVNIYSLRKCSLVIKNMESVLKINLEIDLDDSSDECGDTTSSVESGDVIDSLRLSKT